jgi:oligoendopeptidase F
MQSTRGRQQSFGQARTFESVRSGVSRILVIILTSSPAFISAQQTDSGLASAHISPTLYFQSASSEAASRDTLHARVSTLISKLANADRGSLVHDLEAANQALIDLQRHLAYLRVQTLENTQDHDSRVAETSVETDGSVLGSAIESRLRKVPDAQVDALGPFAFLAKQAKQDAAHLLPPDTEQYRDRVTETCESDLSDAYGRLIDNMERPKDVYSLDLPKRQAAIYKRNAAYDQVAPVTANLLAEIIDLENRDAVAQGYANAADRKYNSLGLSPQFIQESLTEMQAQAPLHRHYEQILAEHAMRKLKLSSVTSTEISLADPTVPKISFSQARHLILDGLEPLGPDYVQRFAQLLNPANGRLDLSGGAHRARTGTSIAVYDAPVAFYFQGYNGTLDNVSVIAHEGGHAIHRELMNASGIPVYERTGPHYLFEGFAMFNELLVLDHATKVASTAAERQYALESFLWNLSDALFITTEETAFERSLYTEANGHSLLDRSKIDSIYRDSVSPYEYWPMDDVGVSYYWIRKSLLFQDPLYEVNYLYAALVAVALYEHAHADPQFAAKYEALLSRGFYATPQTLLATMNINLDDPALIKSAASLFQSKTDELQRLYAAEDLR